MNGQNLSCGICRGIIR